MLHFNVAPTPVASAGRIAALVRSINVST